MLPNLALPIPVLSFSKNPVWVKLQSDNFRAAAPVNSVNYIEFDAPVAAGAVFSIGGTLLSIPMTAAVAPDDSGSQFPTGAGDNAYATSVLPWFQGNYFIDRDYVVTTDFGGTHPRLIFTAKTAGPQYDFTATGTTGVITHGVTAQSISNFMHHVQVWVANDAGSGFDLAFMANVPLDEPQTGLTSIDIHEVLFSMLSHDYPELVASYSFCSNSLRAFYINIGQFYGDIPSIQKITRYAGYFASLGGLAMQASLVRSIKTELCPDPVDAAKNRFLRQGAKNKLISKEQPEWLTWINQTGAAVTVNVEVIIYNDDASSFTFNAVAGVVINANQKVQFQAGYLQLGIDGRQVAKKPVYYQFRLKTTGGSYITDSYNFVVDYQYRNWPRYFVYENSYGAFQTIGTVGKGLAEYDRIKDDAQRAVNPNIAALDGDFMEVNILIQEKFTVSIGYDRSGKRNTALLRDLLASHKIYLYKSGTLIPIGLNTKNLKDAEDGVNIYANSFEYYPLYQQEVWTEDQPGDEASVTDLLIDAGSAVLPVTPPPPSGVIIVEFGDPHLSIVGGQQVYTAPFHLAGLTNYRIQSTQLASFFRTEDIAYNIITGSFTILVPDFTLNNGDQLIIFPYVLNPDS